MIRIGKSRQSLASHRHQRRSRQRKPMARYVWKSSWDLSTVPPAVFSSENGRRSAVKLHHGTGALEAEQKVSANGSFKGVRFVWKEGWDLHTVPSPLWKSERARRSSAKKKSHKGPQKCWCGECRVCLNRIWKREKTKAAKEPAQLPC